MRALDRPFVCSVGNAYAGVLAAPAWTTVGSPYNLVTVTPSSTQTVRVHYVLFHIGATAGASATATLEFQWGGATKFTMENRAQATGINFAPTELRFPLGGYYEGALGEAFNLKLTVTIADINVGSVLVLYTYGDGK